MQSMTGQGQSHVSQGAWEVNAYLRSVNHRHLSVRLRVPEPLFTLESDIEKMVRAVVRRGTVTVMIDAHHAEQTQQSVDIESLQALHQQLNQCAQDLKDDQITLKDLVRGGCLNETSKSDQSHDETLHQTVRQALEEALQHLCADRQREGASLKSAMATMSQELNQEVQALSEERQKARQHFEEGYTRRIEEACQRAEVSLDRADLIRELAMAAEKADISEELTRLEVHMKAWAELSDSEKPQGRKMDFLLQEMNRELNTIGSKANHAPIAHRVVEAKSILEQMREQAANVE